MEYGMDSHSWRLFINLIQMEQQLQMVLKIENGRFSNVISSSVNQFGRLKMNGITFKFDNYTNDSINVI